MAGAYFHPSGSWNYEVALSVLKNLWTSSLVNNKLGQMRRKRSWFFVVCGSGGGLRQTKKNVRLALSLQSLEPALPKYVLDVLTSGP